MDDFRSVLDNLVVLECSQATCLLMLIELQLTLSISNSQGTRKFVRDREFEIEREK